MLKRAFCVASTTFVFCGCSLDARGVSVHDLADAGPTLDASIADGFDDSFPPTDGDVDTSIEAGDSGDGGDETIASDDSGADTIDATPADTGPTCTESGAVTFGGHCYFLVKTSLDWPSSRDACVAAGAHLVTFDVDGEMAAVDGLCAYDECWIDLVAPRATMTASDFHWDDGESPVVVTWCSGEPSGDGDATSACARLKSGGTCTADAPCDLKFFYVCERD